MSLPFGPRNVDSVRLNNEATLRRSLLSTTVATLAAAALLATACADTSATKAGGQGEPAMLTMASSYGHLGFTPAVEHFVAEVEGRSDGKVTIEVQHDFGGHVPDAEQQVVRAVADGQVDLAWVGTRVLDTLGVTSFQAMHAPLLVDSYPLQDAILATDLPERMMDDLDELGVTGLAVLAGGLRIPVGVDAPLLTPDDFAGTTFQLYRSDVQASTLAALGATPTDVVAGARDTGLADGSIGGHEHSLLTYVMRGNYTLAPYLTLNVTLWPETQILLANPDILASLSDTQADWLRDAATEAAARSAELHDLDAQLVAEACANGARFALASDAELTVLREAVDPVYVDLARDPLTQELIANIEALKAAVAVEPLIVPEECTGEAPSRGAAVAEGSDDPGVLNGVYRLEWTVDELVDVLGFDDPVVRSNAGIVTLTFADGRFDQVWESGPGAGDNCPGTYTVAGDRVTMVSTTEAAEWDCGTDTMGGVLLADARFELDDRTLRLTDFVLSDEPDITWWNSVFLGAKPWTRID